MKFAKQVWRVKGAYVSLVFFVFQLAALISSASINQEALVKSTQEAFDLALQNPQKALEISIEIRDIALLEKNDFVLANALNSIGWAYFHLGKLDSSTAILNEAKQLFITQKKKKETVQVALNLAEVYSRNNNLKLALETLIEGDNVNKTLQDEALQTDLYRQFAIIYRELNEHEQALANFQKAIEGFKKQGDSFRLVNTGISLSILYRKLEQWDKAVNQLLDLKSYPNSFYQSALIAENIGETFFLKKDYNSALSYFSEAHTLLETLNLKADVAYEGINLGKTYKALGDFKKAENYLKQSYEISDSLNLSNYAFDAVSELADLYESQGDWAKAFGYLKTKNTLQDSLNLQEQLIQTKELKERYENEKYALEIALLKSQNEIKDKRNAIRTAVLIVTFIAAVIIVWLLMNKIKLTKRLEYESNQNRISGDIEEEKIVNQFAISLLGKNSVEDILWTVAQNCIQLLHFEDCVIYIPDKERKMLVQYAAAGPKESTEDRKIFNPIEIPVSRGIVGAVYAAGVAEIIPNTALDNRYLVDDQQRSSEITVPIFVNNEVFGIIDSEHSQQNFYTERHLKILKRVANICSEQLTKLLTEDKLRLNIARDLHDEVGSIVTSISILSNLALATDQTKKEEYLLKINDQSAKIMAAMSDIIWAINPHHDTIEETIMHMKESAIELVESAGINCKIDTKIIPNYRSIQAEERKYIYLIFKEAVNNAVKSSKASEITISIEQNMEGFSFSIFDNGIGFDLETVKLGNGINNMKQRAKNIDAALSIDSTKNVGTTIRFEKKASHNLGINH